MGFFLGKLVVSLLLAPAWEWTLPVLHVLRQVVSVAAFNSWFIFRLANPSINACVYVCVCVVCFKPSNVLRFRVRCVCLCINQFSSRNTYTYMNVPMSTCRIAEWVLFFQYNTRIRCILDFPSDLYVSIESWTAHSHETWLACSIR